MDWEWERGEDVFIVQIRRSDKPGDDRKSLTMIDRPHGGAESSDRSVFPNLEAVFAITGPLTKDLRAEGWTLMRTRHGDGTVTHHAPERATV
ncbi:hypothetical protein CPT_Sycamore_047 [Streptomyces phage Sycamore]|uniref:Uncharacterized protein n=1 Tax=Streptomyces phage Sycamore TaxID=2767589 RepID=A0A873WDP7_9CAUD|nr:hypothetical protein CPT_Sycamore_047 [Streptomyces phage Sycamore]